MKRTELWVDQPEQVVEGGLVTRVRGGREEYHVALGSFGEGAQQSKSLVLCLGPSANRGVGFLDNDKLGARTNKFVPPPVR